MSTTRIVEKKTNVKSSLILDQTYLATVEEALFITQKYLSNFANELDFSQKMAIAFGEEANVDSLRKAWSANDFSNFPEIEVRHTADINGANGAFAAATNRIYLSQEFITNHQGDVGAIARVLLEEFGHFVDLQLNEVDSPGDEGEIFSALVRGETLNKVQLEQLKAEDDTATIMLNGQAIHIEQDSNEPGINVIPLTPLVTTEAGGTAQFSVQLNSQPTDDVIIPGRSNNEKEGILDKSSLTFTPNNWNIPQVVTVIGVDDLVNDGDVTYTIIGDAVITNDPIYRELGKFPSTYNFINIDDDDDNKAGINLTLLTPLITTEAGGTAKVSVQLNSQPTDDVIIPVISSNKNEGILDTSSLIFTSNNWNIAQTVTITGVDDLIDDGDVNYNIVVDSAVSNDPNYKGLKPQNNVQVINTNDDEAGITLTPLTPLVTTEAGGTAKFSVQLNSQPTDNVIISVISSNEKEGILDTSSLVFTSNNWNIAQTVTITGVDDLIDDGDINYNIVVDSAVSNDPNYKGLKPQNNVQVINTNDDEAGITLTPLTPLVTTEAGGTAKFSVQLNSQPLSNIKVELSSSRYYGTLDKSNLIFTSKNWNQPQTITVTGVPDGSVSQYDTQYSIYATSQFSKLEIIESSYFFNNPGVDNYDYPKYSSLNLINKSVNYKVRYTSDDYKYSPITGQYIGNNPFSLFGTSGSDALYTDGYKSQDILDKLYGQDGSDLLDGVSYNGSSEQADELYGQEGNDFLIGGSGDKLFGGTGNDLYRVYSSNVIITDDSGIDTVISNVNYTLSPSIENLLLDGNINGIGNDLNNFIGDSYYGNSSLFGLGGDDTLEGGNGNDILEGGNRNDILKGGDGDDTLEGGDDNDMLEGGHGNDILKGGIGNDTLYAFSFTESYADTEDNLLEGGEGNDILYSQVGNDILKGEKGNDSLYGGSGNDTLEGGDGNDILYDLIGKNTFKGGQGNDEYTLGITNLFIGSEAEGNTIDDEGGNDTLKIITPQRQEGIFTWDLNSYQPRRDGYINIHNIFGVKAEDTTLWVDTNQNGVIEPEKDLAIKDFYAILTDSEGKVSVVPGRGYIENMNFTGVDLDVAIFSDKDLIGIGSEHQLIYTFKVTNKGTEDTTGVKLEISIPKGINIIGFSLTVINQTTDSEGNTLLTIDAGSIPKGSVFTGTVTIEATGFSQPLDKLQDYLWDIDVKGIATANISRAIVSSNTASISTQVDSSKGLAEDLINEFLIGSQNSIASKLSMFSLQASKDSGQSSKGLVGIINDRADQALIQFQDVINRYSLGVLDTVERGGKDLLKLQTPEKYKEIVTKSESKIVQKTQDSENRIRQISKEAADGVVSDTFNFFVNRLHLNNLLPAGLKLFTDGISLPAAEGEITTRSDSDGSSISYIYQNSKTQVSARVKAPVTRNEITSAFRKAAEEGNSQPVSNIAQKTLNNWRYDAGVKYQNSIGNVGAESNLEIKNGQLTAGGNLSGNIRINSPLTKGTVGFAGGVKPSGKPYGEAKLQLNFGPFPTPTPSPSPKSLRVFSDNFNNLQPSEPQSFYFLTSNTFLDPSYERVRITPNGNEGNNFSINPIINNNGRFVAFNSIASNLGADDTNEVIDVFVSNLTTGITQRINIANDGSQANGESEVFAISTDGRYVFFASDATNLVANDTNGARDIFVRDRQTNTTQRVSLTNKELESNGASDLAAVSTDGHYVVFSSIASNLVEGDTNKIVDVFVRDLQTGVVERISVANDGTESQNDSLSPGAAISADGRYVVFYSYASNLVANDTNDLADIFVRDRQTGSTVRISTADDGTEGNDISLSPAISADGRYIAFSSLASNLVAGDTNDTGDIFVYDQQTKTIERVSLASDETEADSNSSRPSISADGRYVVFQSRAANLGVDNPNFNSNIYLRDRLTGETKLVSPSPNGQIDGDSINPSISADGSYISFESGATNLVDGDTNDASDIFVYKPVTLENSEPVTGANKTLTVLEDTAPTSLAIATPTDADNDPLTITVTAVPETTKGEIRLPNNTVVTANTSLTTEQLTNLVFAPVTNANGSAGTFSYTVSDSKGGTATQTIALEITALNDAPTLNSAIADQIAKEDAAFSFIFNANTFSDVDAGDSLSYSATLKDGINLPSWLNFNPVTRTFSGTPTNANVGSFAIEVRATDNDGLIATDTFLLAVEQSNSLPTFKLVKIADDIFNIFDSSGKSKLKVTLTDRSSNLVNELGVFTVDDAQGNINGIAPGAAGYAQAALDRAKVIFSAIANLPNGFNSNNLTHLLEFNSGDNLRFYLVRNSSTDAVRAGVTPLTDILFSDPLRQKITDMGSDDFSLAWKDTDGNSTADFKDLMVKVQSTNDSLPLGTNLQGKPQGEVIDLRDIKSQVKADFVVNREGAFNNFIGFYQLTDQNGGIDTNGDGKADILIGEAGYTEAAIRGRVTGIDLTVNNQNTATYTGTFQPGFIFAPFIIANGSPDALLDSNPNNDPAVYFAFLGANADKVDHIRLLGSNIFGFEDLASGGDKDFNDVIVNANLSIA